MHNNGVLIVPRARVGAEVAILPWSGGTSRGGPQSSRSVTKHGAAQPTQHFRTRPHFRRHCSPCIEPEARSRRSAGAKETLVAPTKDLALPHARQQDETLAMRVIALEAH